MMASLGWPGPAKRALAVALLGLIVWSLLLHIIAPVHRWLDHREALSTLIALQERMARYAGRAAAVAAMASKPDAPFVTAADRTGVFLALQNRISGAAPEGAMRIEAMEPLTGDPRPVAPVSVRFGFSATQGALYAFLSEMETRPPFLDVEELDVTASQADGGQVILSGTATLTAVPLIRERP